MSASGELAGATRRAPRLGPGRGCGLKQPDNFLPEIEPTVPRQCRPRALDCSRQPCLPSTYVQDHLDSVLVGQYLIYIGSMVSALIPFNVMQKKIVFLFAMFLTIRV